MAALFNMEGAVVFGLHSQEGYSEVGTLVRQNKVTITGFQFIILLCGRGDLWETDRVFKQGVDSCLAEIRKLNEKAIVVLTATLPSPGDGIRVRNTAAYRNGYLSQVAQDGFRLEFAKPGKNLLHPRGIIQDLFDDFNNLNSDGLDVVRRAIEAKFRCAKLVRKFRLLESRRDS